MVMRFIFFLSICLILGACSATSTVQVSNLGNKPPKTMNPIASEAVKVYLKKQPEEPYTEMMLFHMEGAHEESIIKEMRAEAATRGCDGVIFSKMEKMATDTPEMPSQKSKEKSDPKLGHAVADGTAQAVTGALFPVWDMKATAVCIVFNK
jgi:hypothetical protein